MFVEVKRSAKQKATQLRRSGGLDALRSVGNDHTTSESESEEEEERRPKKLNHNVRVKEEPGTDEKYQRKNNESREREDSARGSNSIKIKEEPIFKDSQVRISRSMEIDVPILVNLCHYILLTP